MTGSCSPPVAGVPADPGLRSGSLCTGYGGLDLAAAAVLGARLSWHAESDLHAAAVLAACYPGVPGLGDITALDWAALPPVDLVTAGWPCQDISCAGAGAGIRQGTRSGLWLAIADGLRTLRPACVFLENVAALRTRGLGGVLADLAALGYDTRWLCLRAADAGACHPRARLFILGCQPAARPWLADAARPGLRSLQPPGIGYRAGLPEAIISCLAWPQPVSGPAWQAGPVRLLPTPDTGMSPNGHGRRGGRPGNGHQSGKGLDAAARTLAAGSGTPAAWGEYEPAVRRWERVLGQPAPPPAEPGPSGRPRLSAAFAEWMMGIPGLVTAVPGIPRTAQLQIIGNGAVPQQAAAALRQLARAAAVPAGPPGTAAGMTAAA